MLNLEGTHSTIDILIRRIEVWGDLRHRPAWTCSPYRDPLKPMEMIWLDDKQIQRRVDEKLSHRSVSVSWQY